MKNLTSKKFSQQFKIVLDSLEAAGYNNYWKVLNAKDYGVPQNRERVFVVSIRKDVDNGMFQFPQGFPLELRLKDLCEDEVEEKYYLSDTMLSQIKIDKAIKSETTYGRISRNRGFEDTGGIASTLCSRDSKGIGKFNAINAISEIKCIQAADLNHYKNDQMNRVYSTDGISPAILIKSGGGRETKIFVKEATKKGYAEAYEGDSVNLEHPNSKTRRGRIGKGVTQTLTTSPQIGVVTEYLRIRKLTPKECFRLMDFDDSDFKKAEAVNSNTQLYKQAGNSIVVACPYCIFKALMDANILEEKESKEMELKVNEVQLPAPITFNYEELKQELTEKVSMYESMVYTDDQIKDAKADKASLNKLKKALNDERIRMEKEYMQPFHDFKEKINEIIGIIDSPIAVIDKQVKEYEEQKKAEKLDRIKDFWNSCDVPEIIKFDQIFDAKWLNASVSIKSIFEMIEERLNQIRNDLATLSNLPEFGFEAAETYKSTLDMNKALNEGRRLSEIQKRKAEHEAEQERLRAEAEMKKEEQQTEAPTVGQAIASVERQAFENCVNPPTEESSVKQWISFAALLSTEDALALKAFFDSRNIDFKPI